MTVNQTQALRGLKIAGALAAAAALAGCGGGSASSTPSSPSTGSRLAGLLTFGATNPAGSAKDPRAPQIRSCPEATVLDGGASLRVGGPSGQSVRHQFAITDVARECQLEGGQLLMKVGVAGDVLVGPAGSGGTYSAGVRIQIRAEKDQRVVASKSYRVSATATGSQPGNFTLVTENFSVPFIQEYASDDYTISIAFEGARSSVGAERRRRRR